jgi:elongator complex protein 1
MLISHSRSHRTVASWDAPSPNPDLLVDKIVDLQYLSGTGTTCLVLEGGDIVTVQEDQFVSNGAHIEIMGSIDAGIAAAKWSPDEELLAIVTKAGTVIFMGSTFDPVTEVTMTAEDLKASKHVSVGWGKKETQFRGRGAKALRDPTIPEKVDSGVLSPNDDGETTISWRGDGAFVAISAVEAGSRRVIRVYSREGDLDSANEPVDGLECTLSWRPAGNLIAGVQRLEDRVDIVFFERNGLRHGQFTLRAPESGSAAAQKRIRLEWNADSTVLAVVIDDWVQLWTMGNYHWYLKQEIPMDPNYVRVCWHPEKALRFAVAASDSLISAEHVFHTTRGSCRPPHDIGAVAVIDGDTVKLTPFRATNVPPPMALYELEMESSVVDVAFGRQNQSFAVLHHKGVDVFEWRTKNGRLLKPELKLKVPFESANIPEYHVTLRICCSSADKFRCMNYQDDLGHLQLGVDANLPDTPMILLDDHHALIATSLYEDDDTIEGYGQDRNGKLYRLSHAKNEVLPIHFQTQLPFFELAKVDDVMVAFGLSRNGHMYANSRLLAKNCTSFILTPSHLIFTTNNHFVKFVHLVANVDGKSAPFPRHVLSNTLQNSRCLRTTQRRTSDAVMWSEARALSPPFLPT